MENVDKQNEILFLFLNLEMAFWNSNSGIFASV